MNIALYGGSFDPPHLGHIQVVDKALESLDIDKVIIIPAFVNPFKKGTHAPASLRLKWLRAIFADRKGVEVSDIEVSQNRAVPSVETVEKLAKAYEKIYFIIGADNLSSLRRWHQFERLDELVTWVIATRDEIMIDERYIQLSVRYPISSSELRETLEHQHLPAEVADEIQIFYEKNKEKNAR